MITKSSAGEVKVSEVDGDIVSEFQDVHYEKLQKWVPPKREIEGETNVKD